MRIHELLEDFAREYEWFYSLYIPLLLSYRNQNKKMKKISKNHFSLHLSTVLQIKNILYPDAFDDLALEGAKLSPSLYDVLAPLSEHCLTVWECQQTLAMFFVRFECALERLPFFADITEIPIVKTTNYRLRMLIIKNTSTVEIASFPLSSIIRSTWRIVQWSYTFDLVLDPVALVEHSIRINEHSFPMLFAPKHLSLVFVAILLNDLEFTVIGLCLGVVGGVAVELWILLLDDGGRYVWFDDAATGSTLTILHFDLQRFDNKKIVSLHHLHIVQYAIWISSFPAVKCRTQDDTIAKMLLRITDRLRQF